MTGAIDYWCNAFTPDRREVWNAALAAQGIPLKIRTAPEDAFADPDELVTRLDGLGVDTVILPVGEPHPSEIGDFLDGFCVRPDEIAALADAHPGRFVGQWSIAPGAGQAGVERARAALAEPWCVGLHYHTHSWDRPFDHADLYPHYALCAEHDVPMVVQAGTSGGLLPSACGQPIGIDRPAIFFPGVRFVLSHTGWPWVEETIAMALKHPNVFLGTAVYPPRHWGPALLDFLRGPGRRKCLWGTGFPTTGHHHGLAQLAELDLADDRREAFLGGNARRVFTRLPS